MFSIVLYQPQIPQNTGNVVRTCASIGASLILVTPLGFSITDRWLHRAGLGYWEGVDVQIMDQDTFENLLKTTSSSFYFFSSKGSKKYNDISYDHDAMLIFGSETHGLPESFLERWPDRYVTLPMKLGVRCLNLATTVGIAAYHAWEQHNFQ